MLPDIAPDSRIQSIEAMQVLDDGSIVAAGSAMAPALATGFVTRLHADGSIDTDFGSDGLVRLAYTEIHALAIDSQGRVVVARAAERAEPLIELAVTRLLNSGGSADRVFADGFD